MRARSTGISRRMKPHTSFGDSDARVLIIHADLLNEIASSLRPGLELIVVDPSDEIRRAFGIGLDQTYTGAPRLAILAWAERAFRRPLTSGPKLSAVLFGNDRPTKGIKRDPLTLELVERVFEVARIAYGTEPGMRTAAVTPLYHSAPASYGVLALMQGDLISIHPRFDPERLLSEIEELQLTHLYLVPTLFVRLLRLPDEAKCRYDLSSLRFVREHRVALLAGREARDDRLVGTDHQRDLRQQRAGLVTICSSEEALVRPGTAGRPLPWASVKILAARWSRVAVVWDRRGPFWCGPSRS